MFLPGCLDGAWTYRADLLDSSRGLHAELNQKARRDRAGPPESAAAMDQDVLSAAQPFSKRVACGLPIHVEFPVWYRHVCDRKVEPQRAPVAHFPPKFFYAQEDKFFLLKEGDYGGDPSFTDGVEVTREITVPRAGLGMRVVLARAKGDADAPQRGPRGYGRDHQGMRERGSRHL